MHPTEDYRKAAATISHSDAVRQFRKRFKESYRKIHLQKGFEWARYNYQAEIQGRTSVS